jgi:hypothetical protein
VLQHVDEANIVAADRERDDVGLVGDAADLADPPLDLLAARVRRASPGA